MNENLYSLLNSTVIRYCEATTLRPTNTSRSVCVRDHHILGIHPDFHPYASRVCLLELKTIIDSSLPHMSVGKPSDWLFKPEQCTMGVTMHWRSHAGNIRCF